MANVFEFIMRAKDEASGVLEGIGSTGSSVASTLNENWLGIAGGAVAAGGAIEGMARSQQDARVATSTLARQLGSTESEMKDLITSTSNVTFPMEDVTALFKTAQEQGLESADALQDYAFFWDMVGDATGESGPELAKAAVGLQQMGVGAENSEDALAALGFIQDETTSSVGEFLKFVERVGPEISDMGFSVDETAGLLGLMEDKLGLSGRAAQREFRDAVTKSEGDLDAFFATLGVTAEEVENYTGKVGESSGVIEANANAYAESFTPLQEYQHQLQEILFRHSGLFKSLADLAPMLTAIGPLMAGVQAATKGWSVAQAALNAIMAANPIVLVTLAIIALVAILVVAYTQSETFRNIVNGAWASIRDTVMPIIDWLRTNIPLAFQQIMTVVGPILSGLQSAWSSTWGFIRDYIPPILSGIQAVVETAFGAIKGFFDFYLGIYKTAWNAAWGLIRDFLPPIWDAIKTTVDTSLSAVKGFFDAVLGPLQSGWETTWGAIRDFIPPVWDAIKSTVETAINAVKGNIETNINTVKETWDTVWNAIKTGIDIIWNSPPLGIKPTIDTGINAVKDLIDTVLNGAGGILSVWGTAWDTVSSKFSGIWDGIEGRIKTGINGLIKSLNHILSHINSLEINIPGFDTGVPGVPSFAGLTIGFPDIPLIPLLQTGGRILRTGLAIVHQGETIMPAAASPLGVNNGRGFGRGSDSPVEVHVHNYFDEQLVTSHVEQRVGRRVPIGMVRP